MRKSKLEEFVICMFIFLSISISDIYAQVNLQNGLIAYYPFNGNANDESGNGNDGSVFGATVTTDRFGNSNKAYSFNGSTDYINISNTLIPPARTSYTISYWAYPTTNVGGIVISNRNEAGYGYSVGLTFENTFYGNTLYDNSLSSYTKVTAAGTNLLNKWSFITATYDQSNNDMKIYLNGVQANEKTTPYWFSNTYMTIGRWDGGSSVSNGYFQGKIDDIRIYNRVLNDAEIQALYTDCFTISKPAITNNNLNNLSTTNTIAGVSYQWYINDQIESGQNSSVHTSPLVNANYQVQASVNNCISLMSDPMGIYIITNVTIVTTTEVVTVTNCSLSNSRMTNDTDYMSSTEALLKAIAAQKGSSKFEIIDSSGYIVSSTSVFHPKQLAGAPKGSYTIKVYNNEGNTIKLYKIQLE